MAKRGLLATIGLAAALSLLIAQPASASTQAGNQCVGNTASENVTTLSIANGPGNPLPATMPVAGVITRWTLAAVSELPPGVLNQRLKMFRPAGAPGQYQVIGESAAVSISPGANAFPTRIPVHAGDLIGSSGFTFEGPATLFCETTNPGERLGIFAGDPPPGSVATLIEEEGGFQNPITVTIEPDADNDGYGDETQDNCPQSAATQAPCPAVVLSTSSTVKKGLVTILVTASSQAGVTVVGTVKLGKGKKVNLNGGTQIVVPGTISKFTLLFPKALRSALKELPRKRSLTLKVSASAPNLVGPPTTQLLKLRLAGQAKPKSHKKR
ncbi:MAG TPA: hypothetical protein VGC63_13925 [Solirubrobacterales bacterium]|jgi:hypothetical protein